LGPLLREKTILITGGTSYLGQAFVRKALEHGAKVFFTFHKSQAIAEKLIQLGARGYACDLANVKSMEAFSTAFANEAGRLDILIHNAAATADALIEKMSEEEWDEVMTVNLKAPFYLTKQFLPLLFKSSSSTSPAKVFMIISRAGLGGLYGAANYAASKGGLIAMTKTLAKELGRKKVLVNAVNPGYMRSAMTEKLSEAILQKNLQESPLKTFSDPDEVAGFLAYLSSDLVRQVTGQVFHFESRPL